MRTAWSWPSVALAGRSLTSIPLYQHGASRSIVPSDVDEARVQRQRHRPRGHQPRRDGRAVMRPIEADLRKHARACARCWPPPAAGSWAASTAADSTSASRRTRNASSRSAASGTALLKGDPCAAFQGNYTQRDVMKEMRRRSRKYQRPAHRRAQSSRPSTSAAATCDIDFIIRGPDLEQLADYAERPAQRRADGQIRGIIDADTTLKLDKPELRVRIDRDRAADLGVDMPRHRHRPAADGRRRRASQPLPRSADQRGLRRPAPPGETDRNSPEPARELLLPRAAGGGALVELEQPRAAWRPTAPAAHRPPRPPAHGQPPRRRRARATPWPTASTPCAQAAADAEHARRLHHHRRRPRPRAGADLREFLWAFLLSVIFMYMILAAQLREPGPPADHPALAAAGGAVRPAVALAQRRHAESLFGPGHPGALRRGEEERHPADRPHEPAARARACSATTRSSRATATACARS